MAKALHTTGSCVYVVEAIGTPFVKIGLSRGTAERRLAAIQAASPHELRLLLVIPGLDGDDERELHERFAALRVRGEWFENRGELTAWINRMKLVISANEKITAEFLTKVTDG